MEEIGHEQARTLEMKSHTEHYSFFGRWFNKRCSTERLRWHLRFEAALLVTLFTGISSGTTILIIPTGGTIGFGGGNVLSELIVFQLWGVLITIIPTALYATACAFTSENCTMWWSLLLALLYIILIWTGVAGVFRFNPFVDGLFGGLLAVSIFSGLFGIAAARGIQVLMLRRVEHLALMAEIEAQAT